MNRLKYFFVNGFLLTAVTLLLRTVGVAFNVYISNKAGAVAMGLFGLISTVYGFGITLATSGVNLATTRLVSEELGVNHGVLDASPKLKKIMRSSIGYALFFGVLAGGILYAFAEPIGVGALGDRRTVHSLQILAATLPFIAVSSALSGYFSALRKVYKNAIVQISGQLFKIYACAFLFSYFGSSSVEGACVAIVLGGAAAEILSFFIQYLLYLFDKSKSLIRVEKNKNKGMLKSILKITLPVAFSSYIRSGLVTLEHLLIPWGLKKSGSSKEGSLAAYGTVSSMVFPLILFPAAISSSFAGLLIPEMAESNAVEDKRRINRIGERVFKAILLFSIGTAGLIICFSYELGDTFYPNTEASRFILMLAPLIPVMYIDTSVDSMLKGLGRQTYTMLINVIDATLSVILVFLLLPRFGIYGFIITVYFTEIINATLSITYLLCVCDIKVKLFGWIAKPLFCVIVTTAIMRNVLSRLKIIASTKAEAIVHIAIGAIIYMILLSITKTIELKSLCTMMKRFRKK